MEFLTPRDEIKIPEKDLPKVEEIPKGASRRNMKNGLSNGSGGGKASQNDKEDNKQEDEESEEEVQLDSENSPKHLQMLHTLLKVIY